METEAAKLIATGLAVTPLLGVGIGLGTYFASIVNALGRNPSVEDTLKKTNIFFFALIEAVAIFALGVALLIFFK